MAYGSGARCKEARSRTHARPAVSLFALRAVGILQRGQRDSEYLISGL